MKIKRKTRITNLKGQLWIIIRITIPTVLILCGGILIAFKYTKISELNINDTISVLDQSIQTESDMVSAFLEFAGKSHRGGLRLATHRIQEHHDLNIAAIRNSIPLVKKTVTDMFFIVYILIGAMILQFVFLIYAVIHITNTIYGPARVMEKILKEASEGIIPTKTKLRDNDELKSLFSEIHKACEIIVPAVRGKNSG